MRFKDNAAAANVIEPGKGTYEEIKGRWHRYFSNQGPVILELGCGRGTYTVGLAERYPNANFVGVDIKGSRLWAGSQEALQKGLSNVAFLRTDIIALDNFFAKEEVQDIYLPFPDPRPRDKEEKKRLTSPRFLDMYTRILPVGGSLHLKTDNTALFHYTLAALAKNAFKVTHSAEDVHGTLPGHDIHRQIRTPYEERFLAEGEKIKCIKAVLT